jgi:hypothetical protein
VSADRRRQRREKKRKKLLSRRQQAQRYGVVSRTIERWGEDPDLNLPPEIEINGRFYRDEDDLDAWDRARVVITSTERVEQAQQRRRADAAAACKRRAESPITEVAT